MANPNATQILTAQGTSGAVQSQLSDIQGGTLVSEYHARFYQYAYQSKLFCGGMTLTSINNATFTSATTGATATPIIGLWNPQTNTNNLVVLQAMVGTQITALTAAGPGPLVWMYSTLNGAISTGSVPLNIKTLTAGGSVAKFFPGVALTGITNNLALLRASGLSTGQSYVSETNVLGITPTVGGLSAENIDGSIIVPPGGVVGLFGTATPTAHSAASGILWYETPV